MQIKYSDDLNSNIYTDGLAIRKEVFVDEQSVPENMEVDEYEDRCTYVTIYEDDKAIATARYFPTDDDGVHIQRVAVIKSSRKKGIASLLIEDIIEHTKKENYKYAILGAQDQAQGFYKKLGFKVIGDQYLDAGILHHDMKLDY
ncbi:GNAT family N-acetyltransferase [Companilactobacillus metriopterae]|uniref:GNAT family N-acetyltransferase n=1 Tax=Companilactobacillus metriopterae TaxID=1909267 RepID=UPI00100BEE98|nr:GNAT family N-acetyltransferase [Companilactobacillus metriopterae]